MPLQRVTSLRCRAHVNAHAASYWLRSVLDNGGAPRLGSSVVQGVSGAEHAMHYCLVWHRRRLRTSMTLMPTGHRER